MLYAGSLVPKEVVLAANPKAEIVNTADLSLEEIIARIRAAHEHGLDVARVHTGDPALYGCYRRTDAGTGKTGDSLQVVPGVTAAFRRSRAAAPGVDPAGHQPDDHFHPPCGQNTDAGGRKSAGTGPPPGHLAIYLSVDKLREIVAELTPYYGADCPQRSCTGYRGPTRTAWSARWRTLPPEVEAKGIHPHRADSGRARHSTGRVSPPTSTVPNTPQRIGDIQTQVSRAASAQAKDLTARSFKPWPGLAGFRNQFRR